MSAVTQARSDRMQVVWWWLGTRLVTLAAAVAGSWGLLTSSSSPFSTYVEIWNRWDSRWFESIAVYGYVGPYVSDFEDFRYNVAFFPGFPALMKGGMALGLVPTAAGMLISLVSSLLAAWALVSLTKSVGGVGKYGAIAFLVAPTAVFLTAGYTEALFCAFAFWAWVWARRRSWLVAGLLAGGAALVRPNGLFLAAGLIVMFVLSKPGRNLMAWIRGWPLLLPLIATMGYFAYLKTITGTWTAWSEAQSDFWERSLVDPVTSLVNTYQLIWTFSPTGEPSTRMVTEIAAMAILVAVMVLVAIKRWWPEAVYTGLTALSLGTSTMYHSVPRTLIVIFPLWMLVGLWMSRNRAFRWIFVAASIPVLVLVTVRFTQNQWIS